MGATRTKVRGLQMIRHCRSMCGSNFSDAAAVFSKNQFCTYSVEGYFILKDFTGNSDDYVSGNLNSKAHHARVAQGLRGLMILCER